MKTQKTCKYNAIVLLNNSQKCVIFDINKVFDDDVSSHFYQDPLSGYTLKSRISYEGESIADISSEEKELCENFYINNVPFSGYLCDLQGISNNTNYDILISDYTARDMDMIYMFSIENSHDIINPFQLEFSLYVGNMETDSGIVCDYKFNENPKYVTLFSVLHDYEDDAIQQVNDNILYILNLETNEKIFVSDLDVIKTYHQQAKRFVYMFNAHFDGTSAKILIMYKKSPTALWDYQFYGCSDLISIQLGRDLSYIGDYAFAGCINLKDIYSYYGAEISTGKSSYLGINVSLNPCVLHTPNFDGDFLNSDNISFARAFDGGTTLGNYMEKHVLIQFLPETLPSSIYKNQGNIINRENSSFMLMSTNPLLTGNVKLVVDSNDKLFLDTFKVKGVSALSDRRYRHQGITDNGDYPSDLRKVFGTMPSDSLFAIDNAAYDPTYRRFNAYEQYNDIYEYGAENNNDNLYSENMKILAPLKLGIDIPDYFIVFRTNNIINNETFDGIDIDDTAKFNKLTYNANVVQIYDLSNYTSIGKYLRSYQAKAAEYFGGSIYINFNEFNMNEFDEGYTPSINSWMGISVQRGVLTTKTETGYRFSSMAKMATRGQDKTCMYLTEGFKRNDMVVADILNLEYMFNDLTGSNLHMYNYFGLYLRKNTFTHIKYALKPFSKFNQQVQYYGEDGNEVNLSNISELVQSESNSYIFMVSTRDTQAVIKNKQQLSLEMANNVINKPSDMLVYAKSRIVEFDTAKSYVTIKFTQQIQYGEHFRVIVRTSDATGIIFDLIASNDIRLQYLDDCISPYVVTNQYNSNNGSIVYIYRMQFYTQNINNYEVAATLSEQLQRIKKAVAKFNSFIYVLSCSDDSISIINKEYTDTYIQHILGDAANTVLSYNSGEIDETFECCDDYIHYFSNNITIKCKTLNCNLSDYTEYLDLFANVHFELLGWRAYSMVKFMQVDNSCKYYELYQDIHEQLGNVQHPIVYITAEEYEPLVNNCIYAEYVNTKAASLDYTEYYAYDIISPFNVKYTIIGVQSTVYTDNSLLKIYEPMYADISLMGIYGVKMIDGRMNINENTEVETQMARTLQKGDIIEFGVNPYFMRYRSYMVNSGKLHTLPKKVVFMVMYDYILYISKNKLHQTPLINNELIVDENNTTIIQETYNYLDFYSYQVNTPELLTANCYFDNDKLDIPISPGVNCQWVSTANYFEGSSYLDISKLSGYAQQGHFIECESTLSPDNSDYVQAKTSSQLELPSELSDDTIMSVKQFISNNIYKFPIHKFLRSFGKIQPTLAIYNKIQKTLEFVYYGIKFDISINNDTNYKIDISLRNFNNFEVYVICDYNIEQNNELYISYAEETIMLVVHQFKVADYITSNFGVKAISDDGLQDSIKYSWIQSPYRLDVKDSFNINGNLCIYKERVYNYELDNAKYIISKNTYSGSSDDGNYYFYNYISANDHYNGDQYNGYAVLYDITGDGDYKIIMYNGSNYGDIIFNSGIDNAFDYQGFNTYYSDNSTYTILENSATFNNGIVFDDILDMFNKQYLANYYNRPDGVCMVTFDTVQEMNEATTDLVKLNDIAYIVEDEKYYIASCIEYKSYGTCGDNEVETPIIDLLALIRLANTDFNIFVKSGGKIGVYYKKEESNGDYSYIKFNFKWNILDYDQGSTFSIYDNKLDRFIDALNDNIDLVIITSDETHTYEITDDYAPLNISVKKMSNGNKFHNYYFRPNYIDIFEFNTNDDVISDKIATDCLLCNTSVKKINTIKNYPFNKVLNSIDTKITENWAIMDNKHPFSTNWDNNSYHIYTSNSGIDDAKNTGYIMGVDNKMLFGSKCIVINTDLSFTDWYENTYTYENVMLTNEETSKKVNAYKICINLTEQFYNYFINNKSFITNIDVVDNLNSTNRYTYLHNYINNVLYNYYNFSTQKIKVTVYRKYDNTKSGLTILTQTPDDFITGGWTIVNNVATSHELSGQDKYVYVTISDYNSYVYYITVVIEKI